MSHRQATVLQPVTPQKADPRAIPTADPSCCSSSSRQICNPTKEASATVSYRLMAATMCYRGEGGCECVCVRETRKRGTQEIETQTRRSRTTPLSSSMICTIGQRFRSRMDCTSMSQLTELLLLVIAMKRTHRLRT